jgi:ribosome maturation factor RimP
MMDDRIRKVHELAEEIARDLGIEVYDVELLGEGSRQLLRVTIDREAGVTVDDCESFSRDFGALMDVEDPVEGPYTLEVSSPGLDRPLRRPEHYMKSVGKLAKVVLWEPEEGQSVYKGRILRADDGQVVLEADAREFAFPYDDIKKARLEVEL